MPEPLLNPDFMARLDRLALQAKRVFLGRMKGERRSKKRGVSIEFADYRNYVQGDDLRFIDWNIYGRLERLLLKLFHEEEDLHVYLLIDHSYSMAYGEPTTKLRYAQILAAAIGYVVLTNMERIGVTAFSSDLDAVFPPARGRRQLWRMFAFLDALAPDGETVLLDAVKSFNVRHRRTGIAIVLSDFLDPDGYEGALRLLIGRGMEVFCIQILAPEEIDPSMSGDLKLLDVETADMTEVTLSAPLLQQYKRTLAAFRQQLKGFVSQRGGSYFTTATDVPAERFLLHALREGGLVK